MKQRRAVVVPIALAALAAGAGAAATTAAQPVAHAASATVHLSASKTRLRFNVTTIKVRHGTVTLSMYNPSRTQHSIGVDGHGIEKEGDIVGRKHTSTVRVKLNRGDYKFFCPVEDHRQAGMVGTIVVT